MTGTFRRAERPSRNQQLLWEPLWRSECCQGKGDAPTAITEVPRERSDQGGHTEHGTAVRSAQGVMVPAGRRPWPLSELCPPQLTQLPSRSRSGDVQPPRGQVDGASRERDCSA